MCSCVFWSCVLDLCQSVCLSVCLSVVLCVGVPFGFVSLTCVSLSVCLFLVLQGNHLCVTVLCFSVFVLSCVGLSVCLSVVQQSDYMYMSIFCLCVDLCWSACLSEIYARWLPKMIVCV